MKIVIKIGTSSIIKDGFINYDVVSKLTNIISDLFYQNHNVVLVSSGAVGCGKNIISMYEQGMLFLRDSSIVYESKHSLLSKTLLSGIGQVNLLSCYMNEFLKRKIAVEQVLLGGKRDIEISHFIDNINECFRCGVIPILNANDTIYNK